MDLISAPRAMGKTTKAIEVANSSGARLVVRSEKQRMELQNFCDVLPLTYAELLSTRMRGEREPRVVIDDAEDFIAYAMSWQRVEVVAISVNGPLNFKPRVKS